MSLRLIPNSGRIPDLSPSNIISRHITGVLQQKLEKGAISWKRVSPEIKDFYWNEFKKPFIWDEAIATLVRIGWTRKCSLCYANLCCNAKRLGKKPSYMLEETYKTWCDEWAKDEVQARSTIASKNQRSEKISGAGSSTHTGGSISNYEYRQRMERSLGRAPKPYEVFLHTHKKKSDGITFIDERSRAVNTEVIRLQEELSQLTPGTDQPTPVDELELYYRAVGGEQKKKVYGVGSCASIYYGPGSFSSITFPPVGGFVTPQSVASSEEIFAEISALREQLERERQQAREEFERQQQHFELQLRQIRAQQELLHTQQQHISL